MSCWSVFFFLHFCTSQLFQSCSQLLGPVCLWHMLTKLLNCSNSELRQTKVISSPTHKNLRPMLHVLASNHGSYGSIERSINDNSFLSKYFTDASSFFAWLNLMGHWNLNTKEVSSSTMGTNSRKMSQRSQSLQSYRKNYYRHKLNTTSEKEFFGI